jgi:hypothetical protein
VRRYASCMEDSTVRLRALFGRPLADEDVRAMVMAAARGLAEREGVTLREISASDDAVTVRLGCDKLTAFGFLTELRRTTNAWYEGKFEAGPLWGNMPVEGDT